MIALTLLWDLCRTNNHIGRNNVHFLFFYTFRKSIGTLAADAAIQLKNIGLLQNHPKSNINTNFWRFVKKLCRMLWCAQVQRSYSKWLHRVFQLQRRVTGPQDGSSLRLSAGPSQAVSQLRQQLLPSYFPLQPRLRCHRLRGVLPVPPYRR